MDRQASRTRIRLGAATTEELQQIYDVVTESVEES